MDRWGRGNLLPQIEIGRHTFDGHWSRHFGAMRHSFTASCRQGGVGKMKGRNQSEGNVGEKFAIRGVEANG